MNPLDSRMRSALGVIITIGFFGTVGTVLFVPVPGTVRDIVLVLIGALIASFKDVTGYFFGSSAGSAAKDETIRAQAVAGTPLNSGEPTTVKIDDSDPVKVKETA